MQESSDQPLHSGSRWEPEPAEEPTEVLTPRDPAPQSSPEPERARRGLSTTAAVVLALLLGGLGGAATGLAVAGQRDQERVSNVDPGDQPATVPDGEGPGVQPPGGHRGFGGDHDGDFDDDDR